MSGVRPSEILSVSGDLDLLVAGTGSGAHPHVLSGQLFHGPASTRNLADAVHYIAKLHGDGPGLFDRMVDAKGDGDAAVWQRAARDAFAQERLYLARLAGACGPLPSAPNQSQFEAGLAGHRRSLDMLAQSERAGCALGSALALALEWLTLRALLDRAAERLDFQADPARLPSLTMLCAAAENAATDESSRRALLFGARQLVAIHAMMWDTLGKRAASHASY